MEALLRQLRWFSGREDAMAARVALWCRHRTGSFDSEALRAFAETLQKDFSELGGESEIIALPALAANLPQGKDESKPLGPALVIRKRENAPLQALLAIHTDVVYAENEKDVGSIRMRQEGDWLHAPGSADAKGGIAVLREALLCLEHSPWSQNLGWRVVLNPDEEIGSPGSSELLRQEASACHFGLLFEPALADGALVGERKGSGNFTLRMLGRAAHAGRNPEAGRNAIHALAEVVTELAKQTDFERGLTVNVGSILGGGSVNRVPDAATAQVNFRIATDEQQKQILSVLRRLKDQWDAREGYVLDWQGAFTAPPKALVGGTAEMLRQAVACGAALGLQLQVRKSGGVCDGNRLAAAGLPNVDTLGPIGEGLHGAGEKLYLPSLRERAELAALILLSAASGAWRPPAKPVPPMSGL